MARKISLPIDYIIFNTGYTARIAQQERKDKLMMGLEERELKDVKPLYVYDTIWGTGQTLLSDDVNEEEIKQLKAIGSELIGEGNEIGTIAFKATEFRNIFAIKDILHYDVHYCNMYGLEDIEYAEAEILGKQVKLAIVSVDSESG